MSQPTEEWLQNINARFRSQNVPPKQRPWLAWQQWTKETRQTLSLGDDALRRIFSWFEHNTRAGSQYIGPFYTGAFYYDSCFWPVIIPLVFGRVQLNAW